MSTTPPPGWYPDPDAPHLERWWDGTAWTGHRRNPTTAVPPAAPGVPSAAVGAGGRQAPDGGGFGPAGGQVADGKGPFPAGGEAWFQAGGRAAGGGHGRAVALVAAGAVLAAAIVTGVVLLGRGDAANGAGASPTAAASEGASPGDTDATGGAARSPSAPASSRPPAPSGPSTGDPAVVVDQLNGITLPLPQGWVRPQYVADKEVVMTTDGTYDCPAGAGLCRHGLVSTHTARASDGTSPEALARADIPDAADAAYDTDPVGSRPFGGITSHRLVGSGQIAVAGRTGYFVRWRVTTAKGPGGYVQSLVFPSTVGTEAPVVVRFVLDAGPDGPPLTDIDTIARGIRPIGDADTGGGVGSSLGPAA